MVTGQQLVDAARSYLGVPYKFGGKTAAALDCSGLITLAASDLGVTVVHGSANQIAACKQITIAQAWDTPGAMLYRPGHNALSLGDGRAVEALTTGVTITQRSETYQGRPRFTMGGQIPGITYTKETPVSRPYAVSPHEGRFTSGYNPNRYIKLGGRTVFSPHLGIDIAPPKAGTVGTPVYAMFGGVVDKVITGRKPGQSASQGPVLHRGYSGNGPSIKNPDGERQLYVHVAPVVKVGDTVRPGDLIGYTDRSGVQTGPHMHLTILNKHGVEYDPLLAFNRWKITPGEAPEFTSTAPGSKPAPAPKPNTVDPKVLKRQQDLNKYGDAGVYEDGVRGPVMKAWDKWVGDAQRALNAFKSSKKKLIVDGHYGPVMAAYVGDVQKRNRLVVDRVLGPVMIAWMRSHGSKIPNRPSNRP